VEAPPPGADLFPKQLAGTSVTFNGTTGPLLYTSAGQVSAIVPYGVSGPNVQVVVQYQSLTTAAFTAPLVDSAPALFTTDATGNGQALAVNPGGSMNSPGRPAPVGSFITLYATGEGRTTPAGVDGKPATVPLPVPVLPLIVTIGDQEAFVQYAGGAPGLVAGIMQINVQIPPGVTPGSAVAVVIDVGGVPSPARVTIAVSAN
jgi:uncharacterized protein (TIGR03437 family)